MSCHILNYDKEGYLCHSEKWSYSNSNNFFVTVCCWSFGRWRIRNTAI